MKCTDCGEEYDVNKCRPCPTRDMMVKHNVCYLCACWYEMEQDPKKKEVVIAGRLYSIGQEPEPGQQSNTTHLGMGGRLFSIQFFDGRIVHTHNLWAGCAVPDRHRNKFPDTARFIDGAKEVQVGDITCWNASAGSTSNIQTTRMD